MVELLATPDRSLDARPRPILQRHNFLIATCTRKSKITEARRTHNPSTVVKSFDSAIKKGHNTLLEKLFEGRFLGFCLATIVTRFSVRLHMLQACAKTLLGKFGHDASGTTVTSIVDAGTRGKLMDSLRSTGLTLTQTHTHVFSDQQKCSTRLW